MAREADDHALFARLTEGHHEFVIRLSSFARETDRHTSHHAGELPSDRRQAAGPTGVQLAGGACDGVDIADCFQLGREAERRMFPSLYQTSL